MYNIYTCTYQYVLLKVFIYLIVRFTFTEFYFPIHYFYHRDEMESVYTLIHNTDKFIYTINT